MSRGNAKYIFEASEKPSLPLISVPLIEATDDSVQEYGCLVDDPAGFEIEIVQWPAQGWRPIDDGTGDEGGYVEGIFHGDWDGDILMGRNEAVDGEAGDTENCTAARRCQEKTCTNAKNLLFRDHGHSKTVAGFGATGEETRRPHG